MPAPLLERLGVIPSYYLRYFYFHDDVLASQLVGKPRAAEVAEIERELLELYRDPTLTTKPELLERRGGAFYSEAATQLVASLATGAGDVQVVDVRNNGTIAGLADDDARRGAGADHRATARSRSSSRRSHPSYSGSSSTSPPTSGSPRRPRSPATASSSTRRCSRTRSSGRCRRSKS